MKTLGIIGGLGPESTIEYYRFLLAAYRERRPDGSSPSIIINSLDVQRGIALLNANQLDELEDYLVVGSRTPGASRRRLRADRRQHAAHRFRPGAAPLVHSTDQHRRGRARRGAAIAADQARSSGYRLHHAGALLSPTFSRARASSWLFPAKKSRPSFTPST